jgi:hypothetical protein
LELERALGVWNLPERKGGCGPDEELDALCILPLGPFKAVVGVVGWGLAAWGALEEAAWKPVLIRWGVYLSQRNFSVNKTIIGRLMYSRPGDPYLVHNNARFLPPQEIVWNPVSSEGLDDLVNELLLSPRFGYPGVAFSVKTGNYWLEPLESIAL